MGRATTDARQGFDPVHGLLHGVGRLGGKCFPQGGGMAVPGRRLGMGVKLPEGLEATGLVGVNEIPHGALRHADYARHVVARVAKTYQIERVPLPLHAGMRMGIPLCLEDLHVLCGNPNRDHMAVLLVVDVRPLSPHQA